MPIETCAICGRRAARYVCQECSRRVCGVCFEPQAWLCADCSGSPKPKAAAWKRCAWPIPFSLFIVGLILILVGITLVVTATMLSGEIVATGAVIFIGPIPIVVGTGSCSIWAMILAVVLAILGMLMFVICRKRAA